MMTNAITFRDAFHTALWILFYLAWWAAGTWVFRQGFTAQNITLYFLFMSCWLAWVNNTRTNRVLKALEDERAKGKA